MYKKLSASEKVDLVEDYIKNVGGEITGKTVYKGYPIGLKIIELRSWYANGKIKLTQEIIDRLDNLGLLERKLEKISDKVNELAEYCKKNAQLWLWIGKYTRFPERKKEYFMKVLEENEISPILVSRHIPESITDEKEKAFADFMKMAENYEYIRSRASNGGISEIELEKLKNAGVGRTFGEGTEIIELSRKTGLTNGEIKEIIKNFGSVEEFRKIYIDLIKNSVFWSSGQPLNGQFEKNVFLASFFKSKKQYESFMKIYKYLIKREKLVTCFDLSESNFISRGPSRNLIMAVDENFISGQFLDENAIIKSIKELLTPNEMMVLLCMISKECKTRSEIAKEKLGVSIQRVSQLYTSALEKLRKQEKNLSFYDDLDSIQKMSFIDKYFKYKDIFITPESFEINEEMREELLRVDDDKSQQIYTTAIERVGFSQKTYNWLKRNGCSTINDIISKLILKRDAKKLYGFGNEKKVEIEEKLRYIGISVNFEKAKVQKKTSKKSIDVKKKKEKIEDIELSIETEKNSREDDTDTVLREAIIDLDESYRELEKEEKIYLALKSKIVKILKEKGMTADEKTKEVVASYLWQLESAEAKLEDIAERKRKIMEEKNDRG